jgi:hypothetical protein
MYVTGLEMHQHYRETAEGGLAKYYVMDAYKGNEVEFTGLTFAGQGDKDIEEM